MFHALFPLEKSNSVYLSDGDTNAPKVLLLFFFFQGKELFLDNFESSGSWGWPCQGWDWDCELDFAEQMDGGCRVTRRGSERRAGAARTYLCQEQSPVLSPPFPGGTAGDWSVPVVWALEKPRAFQRGIDKLQRESVIKYCTN